MADATENQFLGALLGMVILAVFCLGLGALSYTLALADHGVVEAVRRDPGLKPGINVAHVRILDGAGRERLDQRVDELTRSAGQ